MRVRGKGKEHGQEQKQKHKRDVIVTTIARLMIPFIQMYALYVMVGTEGAGGGFQGGVVFAASFVLFVTAFGITRGRRRLPESWNAALSSLGLYFYAGIGLLCIILSLFSAQYLNYGALPLWEIIGRPETRGLMITFVVEVGIAITVMAVFTSIFFDLAWKGEEDKEDNREEGGE